MARRKLSAYRLAGLLVLATALTPPGAGLHYSAVAQEGVLPEPPADDQGPMLLSANELVYNHDTQQVYALGGVQIYYAGYRMVANKVEYDQKAGKLMAFGGIEVIDADGNRLRAEKLDVTDDFANGFLDAISVRTPEDIAIAGERAERIDNDVMVLENGVYTACIPCAENPEKPPFWQIRAQRVIQNGVEKTVRLEHPRFQLLGHTIAILPTVTVPDASVKRKRGFLFPSATVEENLGFGISVPYYIPLGPSADVTFTGTGYTQQGFLLEAEYRKRYRNGQHTLRMAGIDQLGSSRFPAGTSDADNDLRGMVASTGEFQINPRWVFGWDVMVQSDTNFARTYSIDGHDDRIFNNQVYLEGLGKRSSLSIKGNYFDVQDANSQNASEDEQAIVLPVIDYDYIAPRPFAGGELSVTNNLTNIVRQKNDVVPTAVNDRFLGLQGNSTRLTSEVEWKKTFTTPQGLQLTPILAARADGYLLNVDNPNQIAPGTYNYAGNFVDQDAAARAMLTAGLEVKYPMLITNGFSSHIVEPIGQIFVRPDERYAGGLPNEDSQSFVFDATTLFDRDKFSGYDRVEGGTRANIGLRYRGVYDNGIMVDGLFGQSFQLAGANSFASPDLVGVGMESGLETERSDYVGAAQISFPFGIGLNGSARFDETDFSLQRTDAGITYTSARFDTALDYTNVMAQPGYAYDERNSEIKSTSTFRFNDNWGVSGSLTYDLSNNVLTRRWVGLTYEDICTLFSITYQESWDTNDAKGVDWTIGARLTLRTLGDIAIGSDSFGGSF
ncbi:Organic solvent tolerance protein [Martelella mediterranea DSM 17316]|uniref:LPS-assembly protein LptD n=2 Tax=Martelella mediterranea TaxID=293089 RepID=A0A1U9Z3Z6_9HYPH|nr:LPS-assembly protein LptD [Martelella mediterranea]AQZ52384.1 Organic solvent tolerance protein [Martelella mediterranea DSM 17316]